MKAYPIRSPILERKAGALNSFRLFVVVLIFILLSFSAGASACFSYSSPDIPLNHWSYEAVEKLAMAGMVGISGLDTKPMTRIQMAYKIAEAINNIENEEIPDSLSMDRGYVEYLQVFLYKLISEFRAELILIGVTSAQIKDSDEETRIDKYFGYNIGSPVVSEHRFVSVRGRKDLLLENENGLRLEDGYNLRTRAYPWINALNCLTVSAVPALRISGGNTALFLDEAAAKVTLFNVEFALAKSAMRWGPGFHGAMLVSNNAQPLNLVKIRSVNNFYLPWVFSNLGSFGVNFFVSRLEKDRVYPKPDFAGLRLEWTPLPYFTVAANRTDIMGGKGRPHLTFSDYWKVFRASGKDEFSGTEIKKTDTDQLASFDAKFLVPFGPQSGAASGMELYFEWAGEDRFAFWENESPGYLIGAFFMDIFRDRGTDFRVEYARTKPAWYNHGIYNAQTGSTAAYTYKDEIMGHHMGGDSDDLFLRISKQMPFLKTPYFDSVKMGAQLDIERHNLSGAVQEKLYECAFDILWAHSDALHFLISYELEYYRDVESVSAKDAKNHIVTAELNMKF